MYGRCSKGFFLLFFQSSKAVLFKSHSFHNIQGTWLGINLFFKGAHQHVSRAIP